MKGDSNKEPFAYKIVGTSHVAEQSLRDIEREIVEFKPDIVCVELDQHRLQGLLTKQKTNMNPSLIFKFGLFGYLFGLVGHIAQQKIGKKMNIVPGKDMLTAVICAKKHDLPVALIDQNIQVTLRKVSKYFGWKERFRVVGDLFKGFFFPNSAMKEVKQEIGDIHMDLRKVPSNELIAKMIKALKKKYPGLHKALVEERNHFMAKRVLHLLRRDPSKRLLVVVGAGHKEDMIKIINKKLLNIEVLK
jgi:pheromone shutdown protein TraB